MVWFVVFVLIAVVGVGLVIGGSRYARSHSEEAANKHIENNSRVSPSALRRQYGEARAAGKFVRWVGVAMVVIGLGLTPFTMVYSQDVGQSKVQVSFTGNLIGQTTETGLHFKAPWVNVKTFDVRNNVVTYIGSEDGPRTGPQITFQDREGVSGNMDVTVRYSLDPNAVTDIYSEYKTQDALITRVINEIVRSEAREATVTRNTIEVYNDRAALAEDLRKGLEERITVEGFIIDDVAIQEIRYSEEVRQRFDDAQAARIEIDRAEANQEAARVDAETKVIEAQGVADANDILTKSLSEEILTQRYIDALNEGSVFVVPGGSTPLITTQKAGQ